MYREARKKAGLSLEEAAFRLHVAPRTLSKYESGEIIPPPEVALGMSREYKIPWLTQHYCREYCAIGQAYSYEVLDRVNTDPASVMLKLVGEMAEAQAVLQRMLELAVNKNRREDFSDREWAEFTKCLHEFLDVEHTIETLKISLGKWCDVSDLISQHNRKCWERGYASKKSA
ncbi:MAG TPA: helix-turn-helix transcriptional regulator [Firmicutes bacterium]|nr:helix-turn-helix transcriptional regulator [Bacillota bacterium]